MTRGLIKQVLFILVPALLLLAALNGPALAASDEDMQTLGMFYEPDDLVVTATRNPKPISQSAENITIITAKEIEMMGAHTLLDVFANVPGIQAADQGGPGGYFSDFSIQGAKATHILLMLDGVTLNQMVDQLVDDVTLIPLQNIERIEIIKGPGSSSWGSALGAVINVVTKSPKEGKKVGGTLSFSGGERGTRDTRGELSGTVGPLGYYLYAGNLASEGFRPNTAVDKNDIYAKLRWEFPSQGSLQFTIGYDRGVVGNGDLLSTYLNLSDRLRRQNFFSTLSFNCPVNEKIDLDLSLHTRYRKSVDFWTAGDFFSDATGREATYGGSARLTWRGVLNTLAVGVDYDSLDIDTPGNNGNKSIKLFSDKYGVFLNDTLSVGDFSFTSGIRYDRMRPVNDFFSPSLGVAWNPTDKLTLRAYGARGYSLPTLKPGLSQAKVYTVQAGIETTYIPYLWLKGTFFWNQLSDISGTSHPNQLKQGVEVEGKTVPIFNTSISAGYTFIDTKDRDTSATLRNIPRQLVKLGIHYDDERHSFRGALLGRYGWLNERSDDNGRYTAMIWDLNLSKKVFNLNDMAIDLFFNVHNLFNGSQYSWDAWKNTPRWFEGGIRFNF
jgi:vitamin B12 transporter